jgi:hypothetical protein
VPTSEFRRLINRIGIITRRKLFTEDLFLWMKSDSSDGIHVLSIEYKFNVTSN